MSLIVCFVLGMLIGLIVSMAIVKNGFTIVIKNIQDYKEELMFEPEKAITTGTREHAEEVLSKQILARKAKENR